MIARLTAIALLLLPSGLHAESRTWKNADGTSTFQGEYLSHDRQRVTIRRGDGRVFTFDVARLHPNDREWLAAKNPEAGIEVEPAINPNAVFDTLCFGDTRKEVEAKLKASRLVETAVDETFFGRFGLNGTFRTVRQIGGLHCELFFDWSKGGHLKEVSLQTQPLAAESYNERLRRNWGELGELLTLLHGKPLQTAGFPEAGDLQDDLFLASHLWRLEGGGSALLGTSMQGGKYMVVVRFTTEAIAPVVVP